MLERLSGFAQVAARRTDIIIALFMIMAVIMLVVPLPTALVDVLIAINIAFSLLILVVAFYLTNPVELSALPPLILLSTLFRLALAISTTRLILVQGNAGHIVKAFGEFVIAGEVVIGLVIFLIITTAQFVVITKGSERVAEVAARFSLDAMPGKQMSIDNDLRSGDIDAQEARRRRADLQRESQLFGAMDGAMKFVKGDAIAGLVILAVNLLGGLLIGMLERGLSLAEAAHLYTLLSVGDGLIAQLPALLISVAAGVVVTRVRNEAATTSLGGEIFQQLGASRSALLLTAAVTLALAAVPGFPSLVFLVLAAILGACGYAAGRRARAAAPGVPAAAVEVEEPAPVDVEEPAAAEDLRGRLRLRLAGGLDAAVDRVALRQRLEAARLSVQEQLGLALPRCGLVRDPATVDAYGFELDEVPLDGRAWPSGALLVRGDAERLALFEIPAEAAGEAGTFWVAAEHGPLLDAAELAHWSLPDWLAEGLRRLYQEQAAEFLGLQETQALVAAMEQDYGELVREALRCVPLPRLAETLRLLVAEGVSLRNLRGVLEGVVKSGAGTETPLLVERLRRTQARQISHRHADAERLISALVLAPALEERLLAAVRRGPGEQVPSELADVLVEALAACCREANRPPLLVVHPGLRPAVRRLARQRLHGLRAVLSFAEIADDYRLHAARVVAGGELQEPRRARALAGASPL